MRGVSFWRGGERVVLMWARDEAQRDRARRFPDLDDARRFLRSLFVDREDLARARGLVARSHYGLRDHCREQIVEALAWHLAHRDLLVLDDTPRHEPGGGVAPEPPPSRPPPNPSRTTFIEILLTDERRDPVANERYRITLPDGTTRTGRTDRNGLARLEGIRPAGPCDISFPDIDGREWS